tara:strand:+ start:34 stop:2277 length:2244 start_codon:yes stop_codon:yes gene_type:complete
MTQKNRLPVLAIFLTFILFSLQHFLTQPPDAKGLDTPENQFSAVRAHNILKSLLRENMPHPVGSDLNRIIKERLKDELDKLGIQYQEQKAWACASRFASCAEVENLIAIIPGETNSPYLALMAHYDSVPMAPGAGDDGAGVVAILETARALKLEAPFKHPIMLILTDAEENGLIGAEAFFKQHYLAKEVGIVINIEGSGSSGSSMVLRTSKNNELLIKNYSSESTSPYGFSFVKEVFKRMPNDTDFSVVTRAKISGIDFAFAGERNHYHTPNDTVDNIDLRTIQHHGENILPLSRKLASVDWDHMGEEFVYGGELYGFWTQWKSSNSLIFSILAALLLILAIFKSKVSVKKTTVGVLLSSIVILATVLSGFIGFYLLSFFSGKVISWPGIEWPYRLLLISSTAFGGLIGISIARKFVNQIEMIFGAWIFWLILTFIITFYLPDAANTFIIPVIFASSLLFISAFFKEDNKQIIFLLTLVMTLPTTLGLIFSLEQSQGYKLVGAILPFIALYALIISPFLFSLKIKSINFYIGLVTFSALMIGSYVNLYTENRPQHVNIYFYENIDSDTSYVQLSSQEPLIQPLISYVNQEKEKALVPFSREYLSEYWAESDSSEWEGPSIEKQVEVNENKSVKIKLNSNRSASRMVLLLPKDSGLKSFYLGSLEVEPILSSWGLYKGYYVIYLNGIYNKETKLTLNFDSNKSEIDAYLMDISTKLPQHLEELYKERSGIFSPVHRGDQSILIKKISI